MIKKARSIFVLILLISICFIIFINNYSSKAVFDANKVLSSRIESIMIYDRGIFGNKTVNISDELMVSQFSKLIVNSKKINCDSIEVRKSNGLCEIEIHFFDNSSMGIELINTDGNGGVLRSGNYCYRNDLLLEVIMGKIR